MTKDDRLRVLRELIKQAEELQRKTSVLIETISEQVQAVKDDPRRDSSSHSSHQDRRRLKRRSTD